MWRAAPGDPSSWVAFPDHHEYTAADVAALLEWSCGRPIIVTEKDAVKLRAYAALLPDVYVLCEEVAWDWGEEAFSDSLGSALDARTAT